MPETDGGKVHSRRARDVGFSVVGVVGDYFLKLASDKDQSLKSPWFYLGFVALSLRIDGVWLGVCDEAHEAGDDRRGVFRLDDPPVDRGWRCDVSGVAQLLRNGGTRDGNWFVGAADAIFVRACQRIWIRKQGATVPESLQSVREGYDRWAAIYDHDANPLQALEEPIVRNAIGDPHGLDYWIWDAAPGGMHCGWSSKCATVTAIDFSDGMLAEARRKPGAERIRFLCHDLHSDLPFADGEFDLLVSGLVLEHLQELSGFFAESRRVLKPGGRAVISAMHPAMFLRGSQARFTDPATGELVLPGSVPHSLGEFVMAALQTGFQLTEIVEASPDTEFAARYPRAEKYIDWPMLVVMELRA